MRRLTVLNFLSPFVRVPWIVDSNLAPKETCGVKLGGGEG
jgi:hypothetical protein